MSRCLPYPPPGYYRNVAKHDALIESIKLQKDTNKTKADRKKEKKAKKEKEEKTHNESRNTEAKPNKSKIDDFYKGTKTVNELYEKSDLTQEPGQPISPHQPSYSSDSTENSNKRKRDDYSLLLPENSTGHGSFKIRFLKKQKASNSNNLVADGRSNIHLSMPSSSNSNRNLVLSITNDGRPSTSGVNDSHRLHNGRILPASYVSRDIDHTGISNFVSNKANPLSVGKMAVNDVSMGPKKQTEDSKKVRLSRTEKKKIKKHVKYEKLIGGWLPPVLQAGYSEVGDDEDWLFKGKTVKPSMCRGEVETCRESVAPWQPCARFLAEVDMHALPYTVPF